MSGWIAVARDWLDNPAFGTDPFDRRSAWLWLIENACWKPTRFDIRGKTVLLERGQICVSRSQCAAAWKWSESAVERYFARLKTEQMIGQATGQGRSIITICNYDKYQNVEGRTGQPTEQPTGQQSDSNRTAKKQGNKETREEDAAVLAREADFDPTARLDDQVPNDLSEMQSLARQCCQAANIPVNDMVRFNECIRQCRAWITAGADPPMIIETVEAVMSRDPGKSVTVLKYFQGAISDAIAQRKALKDGTPITPAKSQSFTNFLLDSIAEQRKADELAGGIRALVLPGR